MSLWMSFTIQNMESIKISEFLTYNTFFYNNIRNFFLFYFISIIRIFRTGIHFNYQILFISFSILCKITDPKILDMVSLLITERINTMLVNKCMYHGNSQPHRTLMNAVQHLLLILLLKARIQHNVDLEKSANWCMDLLGRMPHQPSVRICLEWYIALHFYMKVSRIND